MRLEQFLQRSADDFADDGQRGHESHAAIQWSGDRLEQHCDYLVVDLRDRRGRQYLRLD
jgi:hypothetical protein